MRSAPPALLVLAAALAGCPIPQPLPDYPPGTVTPPRILMATVQPASGAVIRVGTECPTDPAGEPSFELGAQVFDSDAIEPVVARWFVNYDTALYHPSQKPILGDHTILGNSDPTVLVRLVPDAPFGRGTPFRPYQYAPPDGTGNKTGVPYNEPNTIRVVELLVSNNFDADPTTPRQPAQNYEVGLQRWVFLLVPGIENCGPHPLLP
jgi:hypothetical protein